MPQSDEIKLSVPHRQYQHDTLYQPSYSHMYDVNYGASNEPLSSQEPYSYHGHSNPEPYNGHSSLQQHYDYTEVYPPGHMNMCDDKYGMTHGPISSKSHLDMGLVVNSHICMIVRSPLKMS